MRCANFMKFPVSVNVGRLTRTLPVIAVLICVARQAQAADQFDLVCSGTKTVEREGWDLPKGVSKTTSQPWTGRVAVDLESRLFCEEGCSAAESISSIAPSEIVLRQVEGRSIRSHIVLDRVKSTYYNYTFDKGNLVQISIDATCKVAEFT